VSNYAKKLMDPRWQKRRLEIMQRDEWKCLRCGDGKTTLNVHHLKYVYGRDPWEYQDDQLETLCENCHKKEHGISSRPAERREIVFESLQLYRDPERVREINKDLKALTEQVGEIERKDSRSPVLIILVGEIRDLLQEKVALRKVR
jgi:hypothetical protein